MWNDDLGMKEFRNAASHRKAMQNLPAWCHEASYFHWTQQDIEFPEWNVASECLIQEGSPQKSEIQPRGNSLNSHQSNGKNWNEYSNQRPTFSIAAQPLTLHCQNLSRTLEQ